MKIHRFQLEGKLAVASTALGLDVETLRAAVMPLITVQEPRDYTLVIPAKDWKLIPHTRPRWRYIWNVPDALRDQGFDPREAKFLAQGHTLFEMSILDKSRIYFDLQVAPLDLTFQIQW